MHVTVTIEQLLEKPLHAPAIANIAEALSEHCLGEEGSVFQYRPLNCCSLNLRSPKPHLHYAGLRPRPSSLIGAICDEARHTTAISVQDVRVGVWYNTFCRAGGLETLAICLRLQQREMRDPCACSIGGLELGSSS